MNLLPAVSAAPADNNGGAKDDGGAGFGGLLATLASKPAAATPKTNPSQPDPRADASSAGQQLQQVLQALTDGKVNLKAPGLGLTAAQRDRLLGKLEKLLKDVDQDGSALLQSLLAAGLLASAAKTPGMVALTKLLGASAEGSLSLNALRSNLELLTQAVQLVANSDGKLTLLGAIEELAPKGDAFGQQLADVLRQQDPAASDADPPPTGSPPVASSEEASASAGSNGRELTVSPKLTSPADGAAEEANSGAGTGGEAEPAVSALADLLEALITTQRQAPGAGQAAAAARTDKDAAPSKLAAAPPDPGVPVVALGAKASTAAGAQPASDLVQEVAQILSAASPAAAGAKKQPAIAEPNAAEPAKVEPVAGRLAAKTELQPAFLSAPSQLASGDSGSATSGDAGSSDSRQSPQRTDNGGPQPVLAAPLAMPEVLTLATPPAPAAAESVPARAAVEQAIVDQIVQQATLALNNGQQEFRIQLKPDFLGAMEVRVSVGDGGALVRVSADNSATRQLIDANIGQLRQAFGGGNVRVEHVPNFSGAGASWSFNPGGQQGSWQGQNPYQGSNQLPEAIPFGGSTAAMPVEAPVPAATTATTAAPAGAIDVHA